MSEKDRPNTAIRVAIIAGVLILCGTIITVMRPPLLQQLFNNTPFETTILPTSTSTFTPLVAIAKVVADSNVIIRVGPCYQEPLAQIEPGMVFPVTGWYRSPQGEEWVRIQIRKENGLLLEGWVRSDLVEVTNSDLVSRVSSSCPPTKTPTPMEITIPASTLTASPVELAVLNVQSEVQSDGRIKKTADLSITPLGLGSLQITSPATMKLGESSVIHLTITPDSTLIDLPRVSVSTLSANDPGYVLEFSDRLQIYPVMIAELKGVNFDIVSDGYSEKPVTSSLPVAWIWNVTPKSGGKQTLVILISIPVVIDQTRNKVSAQTLKNVPIEIEVEAAATPITLSTPTPLPISLRIREQLIENITAIVVAVLGLIGVLAGIYVTYQNNQKSKVVSPTTKRKPRKK